MGEVRVHHNPACGTSRSVLGLTWAKGIGVRDLLPPREQFGLAKPGWADDGLIDLMQVRSSLINRPIVVSPPGAKLCRPSESVLEILPVIHGRAPLPR